MTMKKMCRFALFTLWFSYYIPAKAGDNQVAEQYILNMKASYGRYQSIQAVMDVCGYQNPVENQKTSPVRDCQTVEYRRVKDRAFCRVTWLKTSSGGQLIPDRRETVASDYQKGKLLREEPMGTGRLRGQTLLGSQLLERLSYNPDTILGCVEDMAWNAVYQRMDKIVIIKESNTNLVVLDFPVLDDEETPWCRIWIDVEKDFFPVRREMRLGDQTVVLKEECRNFQKVNDLWVPLEFSWDAPKAGLGGTYTFREIRLNEAIPPESLDFEFPSDIIVDDQIAGSKYVVGRKESRSLTRQTTTEVNQGNLPLPIAEDALTTSASKGDELLRQAIKQQPVSPKFLPAYVWVLPGKNQYTLELSTDTKTKPTLSGKTFSDSPLVLHGVDDQLASSGKIIVTLERPAGHTAFADAVLTLDFGQTKTPIHFVAAPIKE